VPQYSYDDYVYVPNYPTVITVEKVLQSIDARLELADADIISF